MADTVLRAKEIFKSGYNCAQAVVAAFAEKNGLDVETALKFAGGFGGGMHIGEVCGAVSGGVMVIGMKYAQIKEGDAQQKMECTKVTGEFIEKFRAENGAVTCRELLFGAKPSGETRKPCAEKVASAAQILVDMGF